MDTRNTDAASKIHFMRLCCYYNDTLQELDIRGLTDAIYKGVVYFFFGDLPRLLRADFQHITQLTLHFSMGRRLSLYRVMDALPHLQRLDLHNMTRDNRRRAFFNAALLRPDLRGFPLQVLRIHIRDLTATLMDSIQLELRQLQSITIHGSSTLHQFARETGRIVRDHERALAKHRINPDQNLLTECTVLNTSLASLTFEDNLHVNLYLQHVHRIFSRVTRLRLHNCGMRGGGSLNAGAWNLQSFELDITNIRPPPQTIQVNTGTNARGFRLHNGRYIAIGPNEAFVPDLRLSALSLQQFVIYSAGLNQIFIIDHP